MSGLVVETAAYRLELRPDGLSAELSAPDGTLLASLRPPAAIDTVAGPDETLAVEPPRAVDGGFTVERRSTVWERAGTTVLCHDDHVELRPWVEPDNFNPGYLTRSMHLMPRQGDRLPWRLLHDYTEEREILAAADLDDGRLRYS